jgi:hypothetical protein
MLQTLRNAWKTPDIRKKLIYTLIILLLYRIGTVIPVPFVEASTFTANFGGTMLDYLNTLSGGALQFATLFALGISPYITASIVVQLLTVAIPALERWAQQGEEGKKKRCHGKNGEDIVLKVPAGTVIRESKTGQVIADMSGDVKRKVILKGGRGGTGNMHYATSTMQAPKYARPGQDAKELEVLLELVLKLGKPAIAQPLGKTRKRSLREVTVLRDLGDALACVIIRELSDALVYGAVGLRVGGDHAVHEGQRVHASPFCCFDCKRCVLQN